jgi:putative zinc finger protein
VTCAEARDLFSAVVDGELPAPERAQVDTHLAGCPECRRELERFSRTVSMVRALPEERAPAGFVDRVRDAAHPPPWPRRVARRLFVPLRVKLPLEAAAVLLVATTAVWVFQRSPELQRAARRDAPESPAAVMLREEARPAPPDVAGRENGPAPPPSLQDRELLSSPHGLSAPEAKTERDDTAAPQGLQRVRPESEADARAPQSKAKEDRENYSIAKRPLRDRADTAAQDALTSQVAPRTAATAREADVVATLRVDDRAAADRELDALVARVGGGPIARRAEGDVPIVDFAIPREAYDELTRALRRLGTLSADRTPEALPATVRVSLRITG